MDYSVYQIIWLFFVYAFLGWCAEVCFQALVTGKIVNRGFLNGPWCPIYGVGMVAVLLLLGPIADNLFLLFLLGMVLCTLVELIVGWLLEKIFHSRWWDYSNEHFQLGGYICLRFSLMWGLAVTFVVRLVHPFLFSLVNLMPHVLGWVLAGILMAAFAADFIVTLVTIIGIRKELGELQQVADNLHAISDTISEKVATTAIHAGTRLEETRDTLEKKNEETKARVSEARENLERKSEETKARVSEARENLERKNAESRKKLEARVSETMQELQEKRLRLEEREQELRQHLFTAPKFRTRRLTGAFPQLRDALQKRHEEH